MLTTTDKKVHKYCETLENELMYLTEDELMLWFEKNTIEYEEPSLLKVILRGLNDSSPA